MKTSGLYNDYSGKLNMSNRLNQKLKETHRMNRIRVYGSFYFFLAVVLYIWLSRLGVFYFINLSSRAASGVVGLFSGSSQPATEPIVTVDGRSP